MDKQRLQEEAKYSDEALKQASETVQTLQEQLAKTYVEKEELKSQYYGLQQSSKSLQDVQQQTIEILELEVDNNRRLLEMQTHQIAELTDKFERLTALCNKELEVTKGRETLLTDKMEHYISNTKGSVKKLTSIRNNSNCLKRNSRTIVP